MARHTIHVPDSIESIISIQEGSAESYSGRVAYLISLADILTREHMPELTANEWCAIVEANTGTLYPYNMGVQSVLSGLWHNLFDFTTEGDQKWGVDCVVLARRMQAMPIAAQAAVFEVIKRFWARDDLVNAAVSYDEAFRAIGAKVK